MIDKIIAAVLFRKHLHLFKIYSHYNQFFFTGLFQAVRALMIVGVVLAGIAALIAIFALKCIKMGGMEDTVKANLTLTSGIMFILSGRVISVFNLL